MAGASDATLAIAVAEAGGLGALPCAMLTPDAVRAHHTRFRAAGDHPVNLNVFVDSGSRSFDGAMCDVVEEVRPRVVSFHFGLPAASLLERVRATGAVLLSSATTVDEARWLEDSGCDVIIAQGSEAGGHRGMFLRPDLSTQVGTFALVPQIVDVVHVPVVAAGGISDGRGVAAAMILGAAAVQIGTAFLLCPEALTSPMHRAALQSRAVERTALTDIFTGRPARAIVNRAVAELGPIAARDVVRPFPQPIDGLAERRAAAEASGSNEFTSMWSGQAASLARPMPAGELVRSLAEETALLLGR